MVELIYENKDWLPFFTGALDEITVPWRLNYIEDFELDLNQPPDNVIYLNRISPSSHTRGHNSAIIRGEQYLEHLAAYNRTVLNGAETLNYEMSKVEQYRLLERFGLNYPPTVFSSNLDELIVQAYRLNFPVLTKHNCSGKGLGIRLVQSAVELRDYLGSTDYEPSPDGILLVQQYIQPRNDRITRVELLGGELVYAFHSSTKQGFELCPADACAVDREGLSGAVCSKDNNLFSYIPDFDHPLAYKYAEMAREVPFDLVGIEFVEGNNGVPYTYDINATTNYSPDVENASGHLAKLAFQRLIKRTMT
ncbi:MAG: RimK family alpha-L-glutamate ligase [Candidatus Zixiibacteriota bacterium]